MLGAPYVPVPLLSLSPAVEPLPLLSLAVPAVESPLPVESLLLVADPEVVLAPVSDPGPLPPPVGAAPPS